MKQTLVRLSAFLFAVALINPASLLAQNEEKVKEPKEKEKKELRQIIITSKGKDDKLQIEVNGEKITVNGKPLDEFVKENKDISVHVNKVKDVYSLNNVRTTTGTWNYNDNMKMYQEDANRAMLGVTTEKADEGVRINSITKESAAQKIGLKEGDIIRKINETKIDDPDDLSAAIRKQKPGDKVTVVYSRDSKEQTGTAELTKWKTNLFSADGDVQNYLGDLDLKTVMPRVATPRGNSQWPSFHYSGSTPKLGLSVQDTDDGKGVKVLEVDNESNAAKAGIKSNDVISEIDGQAVNSTDEAVKIIKASKEKISVMVKLQRDGKTQSIELKMPRKIKTTDL